MPADIPAESRRKVDRGAAAPGCPVRQGPDDVWYVQDFAAARSLLRHGATRQAGFGIENVTKLQGRMRMPVIFRDGPQHREHRRQTARFFTPRRVDQHYRSLMEGLAGRQCDVLRRNGQADLSRLAFTLAVAVAGEVVGLTDGPPGMAKRLNHFFDQVGDWPNWRTPRGIYRQLQSSYTMASFYWLDVRPAIAARRRQRRDDLISHLIDEGCTNGEILGECVTFGAAGMITTREFITLAAWHLFTDDALRLSYVEGDEKARLAILHEILRLEPVVANLARWTTADIELDGAGGKVTIPTGARLDIGIAAANLDPAVVGPRPGALCPGRSLPDGVGDAVLAFGDGPHRCPGASIAMQETDIFLTKLFTLPGLRMIVPPTVRVRPEIASYELVGMRLAVG